MVKIRRAYEALFLGLFLFFLLITDLRYLKGWPVSLFLEATPLVAVSTALTTHTIYRNLVWGLVIIAVTMMLGRVWCNWMCPFGILHHLFGWLGNRRNTKQMIEVNRYRKIYAIKYYILAVMLAMASLWIIPTVLDAPGKVYHAYNSAELPQKGIARVFAAIGTGVSQSAEEHKQGNSSLQIGLLDPIALTVRSMTTSVLPTAQKATESIYTEPREYWQAWLVGLMFIGLLVANWWIPRFFCRVLCPLGALLGIFSKFALWRIDRDPVRCTDCDLCLKSCEGASDPHQDLRKSECFVCLNCIEDCPHDALTFRFLPRKASEVAYPAVGRRELILAGMFGFIFFPMTRLSGGVRKNFSKYVIRPPGSVAEDEFLRRCIKCDQCIRVCPTNVLQPAMFEAGAEGLWTPIMISKMGWCELNCTLCSQVCPTGAIREISIAEKLGVGPFEVKGPIKTGTAFYNQGRCLPWAMDVSCVVCEEVCPVSPKAIFTRNVEVTDRWGKTLELKRPYIDPVRCIGCGICEHECPVKDDPAVYVTAIGETRDKTRSLLLSLVDGEAQGLGLGMIEDVETGRLITTDIRPVEPDDFQRLGPGWRFDWRAAVESVEVFKLIDPAAPDAILGLMALRRQTNYVEVTLLESHAQNVGRTKKFRGIPGSLFAFAAQLSFELGGDGFLTIDAKTELIEHYQLHYGFERLGNSQRMVLTTLAAARLIARYGGRPDHE